MKVPVSIFVFFGKPQTTKREHYF